MAKGGRFGISVNFSKVEQNLQIAVSRVERGTKKATIAACEEIKAASLAEVPRETSTLAASAFYEVSGSYTNFEAVIGYGGNGNPMNPRNHKRASQYMVQVHEDLSTPHATGKAKFLEDPMRNYQDKFLPGVAARVRSELR